jgi:tetratricopeptide (TPR) repeat protein
VRRVAVAGHERLPAEARVAALAKVLDDPVRAVRIEAARLLAPAQQTLPADRKQSFERALGEFFAVQQENADRPEAHVNLGNFHLTRGEVERAETAYRKAVSLDTHFIPGYVNLADLYRSRERDPEAEQVLRAGLKVEPRAAALHEALGFALVRLGRKEAALAEFAEAARNAANSPRHAYIYAVALDSAGRRTDAINVLRKVVRQHGDRDALLALASFSIQSGDRTGAEAAMQALASINPDDPALTPAARGR